MTTDKTHRDLVKLLNLKEVGIALAGLWVIVFIAAASATIYREFDGPTVRTVMAQNVDLSTVNISLNTNLDAVQIENAQLNSNLLDSRAKLVALKKQFESYIASFAPIENASKIPLSIGIRSFP